MSLPVGVTTATLNIGRPFDALGNIGTLKLSVVPVFGGTAARLIWSATGDSFESFTVDIGSDPDGDATETVALPVVDQAGWVDASGASVTGWSYQVKVTPTLKVGGRTQKQPTYTKYVSPLTGQSNIDLDMIPDGTAAAPSVGAPLNFARVVAHGSDATVARPVGATVVIWAGSVQPNNMNANYDIWVG